MCPARRANKLPLTLTLSPAEPVTDCVNVLPGGGEGNRCRFTLATNWWRNHVPSPPRDTSTDVALSETAGGEGQGEGGTAASSTSRFSPSFNRHSHRRTPPLLVRVVVLIHPPRRYTDDARRPRL